MTAPQPDTDSAGAGSADTRLADELAAAGHLTDGRWRAALRDVPRDRFIPDVAVAVGAARDASARYEPYLIDRLARPEQWRNTVHSDTAIVTQLDDGATELAGLDGDYTSSASAPGVVLDFLELLDPYDGDEVLEIGTGTGWTAALLACRLGAPSVTSIEIDPRLTEAAAVNTKRAGFAPRLITGDGTAGDPGRAPYDRVHVTCGVSTVPYTWVEQTRPGGMIVYPWMPGFACGHQVRLTVTRDGATGRLHGGCDYMLLRAQRTERPTATEDDRVGASWLDPRRIMRSPPGAAVAISALAPGVASTARAADDGTFELWLWADDSDAYLRYSPDYKQVHVQQAGPRDLWNEVEAGFWAWLSWGSPARDRFGLTVTPTAQHVWLDSPDHVIEPQP